MNKLRCLIVLVTLLLGPVWAWADSSTTMLPLMEESKEYVEYLEENDMEVVHIEYDLIFKSSPTKTITRTFSGGYDYFIAAFADDRITDVDVFVYRKSGGDWTLVKSDEDSSSMGAVRITVNQTGEYMIKVKASKFDAGYTAAHFGVIIAHNMK